MFLIKACWNFAQECRITIGRCAVIYCPAADRLCDPLVQVKVGEQVKGAFLFMNRQESALIINGSRCNPLEIEQIRVWQK